MCRKQRVYPGFGTSRGFMHPWGSWPVSPAGEGGCCVCFLLLLYQTATHVAAANTTGVLSRRSAGRKSGAGLPGVESGSGVCSLAEAPRRVRGLAVPGTCWVLTRTDGPLAGATVQEVGSGGRVLQAGDTRGVSQGGQGLRRALGRKGWTEAAWKDRGWLFILGRPSGSFPR